MNKEIKDGILVAITVILVILVVYFTTAIFMTGEIGNSNKSDKKTTTTNTENVETYDDKIIASKTFEQNKGKYMVIFFSPNKVSESLDNAITSYSNDDVTLYKVSLDEVINKYVKADEDNPFATNSSELKVKDMALITIENGKVTSYVTEESEIVDKLK